MNYPLLLNEEVAQALKNNKPIVALESTIISHGMPYPTNLEVARHCEDIIRQNGATPATIAIIKGQIVVGVTDEQLEYLATSKDILKVSRRDLPYVVAKGMSGATTVAATMIIAKMAGIHVFATGGIGGVHRDANLTFDISADLEELAKTSVCVVCAGAKAILDLPMTMEYLETKGVLVIGYQTNYLPAFYTKESDIKVPLRLDSAEDIARVFATKQALGLESGILVTNPIPKEYSLDKDLMNHAIDEAITKMNREGITGKEVTPFLLSEVTKLTGGDSLEANKKLVYNNCYLASLIAKAMNE